MKEQKTPEQKALDKAFKLLDEYNKPETSEDRVDKIVTQLYKMGYVIRPAQVFVIGNSQWRLVDRKTSKSVERAR